MRIFCLIILTAFYTIQGFSQDPNFHIYLAFGQSNMAGAGEIEAQDLGNVDPRFQFMKPQNCPAQNEYTGQWYTAEPPLWGCTGGLGPSDYFGREMVENLPGSIKVGVIVVAIPGCKIELFGKTGYEGLDTYNNVPSQYNGSAYEWLVSLAKMAQQDGVIKGILLHQGESNTGDQQWPNKVKGVYDNLMEDLSLNPEETPLLAGELLYQQYNSCCSGHNNIIRNLPNVIPNAHVISAQGLPGKDVYHFNSAGVREFGVRYAQKMLELMPAVLPVTVNFTSPTNNAVFYEGDDIAFEVTATSTERNVVDVGFYFGDDRQHLDDSPPYTYSIQNASPGTYLVRAIATDENWNFGESTISVRVVVPQSPYGGTPHAIPGRIEAEEYDLGGEGLGFHEANSNGNEGGAMFRNDEVDIEETGDTDGAYNVGYILNGEWLEYTVNVASEGVYDLELRMARDGANGILHIEMDGEDVTGTINVPNTGGWQVWETVTINDVELETGVQEMRIVFESNYMNLNYVDFIPVVTDYDNDGTPTSEDCDDSNEQISGPRKWYEDADNDGLGDNNTTLLDCFQPEGYVLVSGDECPNDQNKIQPGECGCGETEESCLDCAGTPNGTAAEDACGTCAGGTTGITPVTNPQECIATGLQDTNEVLDLYPNPFQHEITISTEGTFTYTINDISGNLIETGVSSEGKGIGSNLSPGMYFITIEQSSGVFTEKIVKQ